MLADKLGLESIRTAIVADNHDGLVERLQAIERQMDAKDEDEDEGETSIERPQAANDRDVARGT